MWIIWTKSSYSINILPSITNSTGNIICPFLFYISCVTAAELNIQVLVLQYLKQVLYKVWFPASSSCRSAVASIYKGISLYPFLWAKTLHSICTCTSLPLLCSSGTSGIYHIKVFFFFLVSLRAGAILYNIKSLLVSYRKKYTEA